MWIYKWRKKGIKIKYRASENNILEFKGKCLNKEKSGKIEEYDLNGRLIFESEYLNDKNGFCKEFY